MKTRIFKEADRGSTDYGWLKPNYYFSFAGFHDPEKVHFGLLRVLNDDLYVAGFDNSLSTGTVFMLNCSGKWNGNDLHIVVRVSRECAAAADKIII